MLIIAEQRRILKTIRPGCRNNILCGQAECSSGRKPERISPAPAKRRGISATRWKYSKLAPKERRLAAQVVFPLVGSFHSDIFVFYSPFPQTANQRSVCGLKRRSSGVSALRLIKISRSKRYIACSDVVRPTGFEPAAFRVGVIRPSNRKALRRKDLVGIAQIFGILKKNLRSLAGQDF